MPRYFSMLEAESLLPQIESLLRLLIQLKQQRDHAHEQIDSIIRKIGMSGGMIPDRERIIELRSARDSAAGAIKSAFEEFNETGCQLKDLDTGLVDFPTLYRGREVFLCWKLGESGIDYWHHVEDGYPGRRKIDSEFLANHRSTSTH